MPLSAPSLDTRDYAQLREELISRIPVHTPEWTQSNQSDPGITLIELFAFLGESLLWQIDERQRRRRSRRRLVFLVAGTAGAGLLLWSTPGAQRRPVGV